MKNAIAALFGSRKFLLVLAVLVAATVLVALGKLPLDQVCAFCAGLVAVLVAAIAHEDAAEKGAPQTFATGGDSVVNNVAKAPPAIPAEAVTKPVLDASATLALLLLVVAVLVPALVACGANAAEQAAADSAHGWGHTTSLAECGQRARQAATNAGGGSRTAGGSDAGDVAAINAERECLAEMKDGGK